MMSSKDGFINHSKIEILHHEGWIEEEYKRSREILPQEVRQSERLCDRLHLNERHTYRFLHQDTSMHEGTMQAQGTVQKRHRK